MTSEDLRELLREAHQRIWFQLRDQGADDTPCKLLARLNDARGFLASPAAASTADQDEVAMFGAFGHGEPSEHVAPAGGAQPPDPEGDRNRHNAMLVEAWREEFATLCKVLFPGDNGPIGWKHVQAKVKALADGVEGKT